ncbi:MAG: hypothetical protein FJ387_28015 [Verrucomicrobia bacterium]|nr:hypothetical protein [Verrucomicrobiota bacterium]
MQALASRRAASGARVNRGAKSTPGASDEDGLVIDYLVVLDQTAANGTPLFQGDTTYLVTGPVYCNTPRTIEGGAVSKFLKTYQVNPTSPTIYLSTASGRSTSPGAAAVAPASG